MFKQVLESNLGIGKSKLGFWGEKWVFPESCTMIDSLFRVLASFSHISVLNWPLSLLLSLRLLSSMSLKLQVVVDVDKVV
ncbi:hypothetical protein MTR_5g008005 [Medicago truncatula]|uniref:Uncharacterized protein n=1 Tax=Medicago truncatula TaxID=3880 RepID=A0A072UC81_MEDTR|nr:hypothetical protein MTR_5g008005 [Medicago truncatula]